MFPWGPVRVIPQWDSVGVGGNWIALSHWCDLPRGPVRVISQRDSVRAGENWIALSHWCDLPWGPVRVIPQRDIVSVGGKWIALLHWCDLPKGPVSTINQWVSASTEWNWIVLPHWYDLLRSSVSIEENHSRWIISCVYCTYLGPCCRTEATWARTIIWAVSESLVDRKSSVMYTRACILDLARRLLIMSEWSRSAQDTSWNENWPSGGTTLLRYSIMTSGIMTSDKYRQNNASTQGHSMIF